MSSTLSPDEPVESEGSGAVVGAVVKRWYLIVFPGAVSEMWILNAIKDKMWASKKDGQIQHETVEIKVV